MKYLKRSSEAMSLQINCFQKEECCKEATDICRSLHCLSNILEGIALLCDKLALCSRYLAGRRSSHALGTGSNDKMGLFQPLASADAWHTIIVAETLFLVDHRDVGQPLQRL